MVVVGLGLDRLPARSSSALGRRGVRRRPAARPPRARPPRGRAGLRLRRRARRALREATEGRGADVVMLTAGGAAAPAVGRRPRARRRAAPLLRGRDGREPAAALGRALPSRADALRHLFVVARRAARGLRAPEPGTWSGWTASSPTGCPLGRLADGVELMQTPRGGEGLRHPVAMKAQVFHGPGDLRFEDLPVPEPGRASIVVRIEAALTCGTDVKTLRRGHPGDDPARAHRVRPRAGRRGHRGGPRRGRRQGRGPGRRGQLGAVRRVPPLRGRPPESLRGPPLRQRGLRRVHRAPPAPGRPERGADRARGCPPRAPPSPSRWPAPCSASSGAGSRRA